MEFVLQIFYRFFYFAHMKAEERLRNKTQEKESGGGDLKKHTATMQRVFDRNKRPIRALWRQGKRYYAQLRFSGEKHARKIPLYVDGRPARTVPEAIKARDRIKLDRDAGKPMTTPGPKPKLKDAIEEYLKEQRALAEQEDARRRKLLAEGEVNFVWDAEKPKPSTVVSKDLLLQGWLKSLGNIRVDKITRNAVQAHLSRMRKDGRAASTINGAASALNVLMEWLAQDEGGGHLNPDLLPTAHIKRAKIKTAEREFLSPKGVQHLVETAKRMATAAAVLGPDKPEGADALRNGAELADLVKVLALAGGRLTETLRLRWSDIGLLQGTMRFGADGRSKNGRPRNLPLNPELEEHLREMHARRIPDCEWLFPSPRRPKGEADAKAAPWSNPHKSWHKLRAYAAKVSPTMSTEEKAQLARLKRVRLHDLRHCFASVSVMAGVDIPTVASFLGHMDGGQLVSRVYGHLADTHKARMAQRLSFMRPASPQIEDAKQELAAQTQDTAA